MAIGGTNRFKLRVISSALFGICLLQGCSAYKFSSPFLPLKENENGKLFYQGLVLGIERPDEKAQAYELGRFADDLRKAGLFKAVDYTDRVEGADLILTSFSYKETDVYQACPLGFAGQLLTVGTGGIIPQLCNSKSEVSFVLYPPKNDQRKKMVSFTYETHTILGWAALFYTPSSAWTVQPSNDERPNLLKGIFSTQAPDLQKILR